MKTTEDVLHRFLFDPQAVIGAKRVILCPTGHSVNLASVDATQKSGLSKVGYTFAGNGEVYRGSGINELEQGVYVMDESATLVKIKSPKQLEAIMNNALGEPKYFGQHQRRQTLQDVANKWFEAHPRSFEERKKIVNKDLEEQMKRVNAIDQKNNQFLRQMGEAALQARVDMSVLMNKDKLFDADRILVGENISKMILFEIASRSPNTTINPATLTS